MIKTDFHGVDVQMIEGLIHQDVQGQAQVEGGCNGGVYIAQGRESANLHLALLIQLNPMDGISGDFCKDGEQVDFLRNLSALINCNRSEHPPARRWIESE